MSSVFQIIYVKLWKEKDNSWTEMESANYDTEVYFKKAYKLEIMCSGFIIQL